MTNTNPTSQLHSIQYLRGFAAFLVLLAHLPDGLPFAWNRVFRGGIGVDLFFVISGFVMALTISRQGQGPRNAGLFLLRRILRIVPLYFLATLITAILQNPSQLDWKYLLLSISTLPLSDASGAWRDPFLFIGWSLTFEMFFYLLLTLLMIFRAALLSTLAGLLMFLILWGAVFPPETGLSSFLTCPILAEFCLGFLAHRLWQRYSTKFAAQAKAAFALIALVFLFALKGFDGDPYGSIPRMEVSYFGHLHSSRALGWGLPSFLFFLAVLNLEPLFASRPLRILKTLGDESYSLYLFHVPLLALLTPLLGVSWYFLTYVYLAVALLIAHLSYKWLELPLMALSRRLLRGR